jgi:hypothetical protein
MSSTISSVRALEIEAELSKAAVFANPLTK